MSSIEVDALKKVRLDEGDVLLVSLPEAISMVEIDRISDVLRRVFPDNRVAILEDGFKIEVVRP